jgi:hypothetical protein
MKITKRRAALAATAGVTAAIGSALAAAPASAAPATAEEPVTVLTDVTQRVYCNQSRAIGTENGAMARVTTSCSDGWLTVTGSIDDTEQDGKSACVSGSWPDGGYNRERDTQDDNVVTPLPSDWKHQGNSVSIHVWTCA